MLLYACQAQYLVMPVIILTGIYLFFEKEQVPIILENYSVRE